MSTDQLLDAQNNPVTERLPATGTDQPKGERR